jgi:hypothetical protein
MARAKKPQFEKVYAVVKGCDTADGKRYERGDLYETDLHSPETTAELLDSGALANGDS